MNKLINPILFIMCLFVTACSDDNNGNEPISSFSLDKTYYEVRLGRGSTNIHVTNGSGYISLSIEDEKILNAKYAGGLYAGWLKRCHPPVWTAKRKHDIDYYRQCHQGCGNR